MSEPEPEEPELLETLWGTFARPWLTFALLSDAPSTRSGAAAVALTGIGWGALSLLLWSSGRAARFVLLPLDGHDFYLVQGVLMLPLLTVLWWVMASVSFALAKRLGGEGQRDGVFAALGFAYALPLGLHVGAEMTAYLLFGFEALGKVARVSMPLAALWVWVLCAGALRVQLGLTTSRAVLASFAGLLAQLLLGAPILR